jgi:predicted  nucleic acid-binding Zn-ribbon protein
MKVLLVGIAGIAAFFLSSCMDLKTSEQLDSIEAMNQTIDSLEKVFEENRLDSVANISLKAYGVENRIKNNYVSDTINMEFGKKMDAFKVMRRNLKPLGKALTMIPQSIEEERVKLKELQEDIENGNGKREKYDEYIAFEQDKVNQLKTLVSEYMQVKEQSLKTYNELYDELNSFSMSLLKK